MSNKKTENELNSIEVKKAMVTDEKKENFNTNLKIGVLWIKFSEKMEDYYLSGMMGDKIKINIYPRKDRDGNKTNKYSIAISGTGFNEKNIYCGHLQRFSDNGEIWFDGELFGCVAKLKKNKYREGNQPNYFLYLGEEIENLENNEEHSENFEKAFAA